MHASGLNRHVCIRPAATVVVDACGETTVMVDGTPFASVECGATLSAPGRGSHPFHCLWLAAAHVRTGAPTGSRVHLTAAEDDRAATMNRMFGRAREADFAVAVREHHGMSVIDRVAAVICNGYADHVEVGELAAVLNTTIIVYSRSASGVVSAATSGDGRAGVTGIIRLFRSGDHFKALVPRTAAPAPTARAAGTGTSFSMGALTPLAAPPDRALRVAPKAAACALPRPRAVRHRPCASARTPAAPSAHLPADGDAHDASAQELGTSTGACVAPGIASMSLGTEPSPTPSGSRASAPCTTSPAGPTVTPPTARTSTPAAARPPSKTAAHKKWLEHVGGLLQLYASTPALESRRATAETILRAAYVDAHDPAHDDASDASFNDDAPAPSAPSSHTASASRLSAAVAEMDRGFVGRALRMLLSPGVLPLTSSACDKIRSKYPAAVHVDVLPPVYAAPSADVSVCRFTAADVVSFLATKSPTTGSGSDGWCYRHVQDILKTARRGAAGLDFERVLAGIHALTLDIANGRLSTPTLRPLLTTLRGVALRKVTDSRRSPARNRADLHPDCRSARDAPRRRQIARPHGCGPH